MPVLTFSLGLICQLFVADEVLGVLSGVVFFVFLSTEKQLWL